MEHIFLGVQLCIKISIFSEVCKICYIYHPTLDNSLYCVSVVPGAQQRWQTSVFLGCQL